MKKLILSLAVIMAVSTVSFACENKGEKACCKAKKACASKDAASCKKSAKGACCKAKKEATAVAPAETTAPAVK